MPTKIDRYLDAWAAQLDPKQRICWMFGLLLAMGSIVALTIYVLSLSWMWASITGVAMFCATFLFLELEKVISTRKRR